MTAKTDPAASDDPAASNAAASSSPGVESPSAPSTTTQRKPRFAILIATAAGLGYVPKAPGTLGSLAGVLVSLLPWWIFVIAIAATGALSTGGWVTGTKFDPFLMCQCILLIAIAAIGTWASNQVSAYWREKDPQRVVIDEVSGQHLALLLGCGVPAPFKAAQHVWTSPPPLGLVAIAVPLNWKYLLLGFILFRVFDIWKPFPVRQAESLPGGWGIMADDWIAGIYAAIGLWLARAAGL
jgi:phosphatidylglycerophosphatase A